MLKDRLNQWDDDLHRRAPVFWRFVKYRFRRGERYGLAFTLAFLAVVAATWVFLILVESITERDTIYRFDFEVQRFMRDLLTPGLTEWVVFITDLGGTRGTVIGVLVVGAILLLTRRWWELFGLVVATAGGGLVLMGLKLFFERARPVEKIVYAGGYSFPSGHAMGAMVFFGYVIYLAWHSVRSVPWRMLLTAVSLVMILLIGSSRVYLNVHWLTDVVGGFMAGFVWLLLSIYIVRTVEAPPWRKKRHHLHIPHVGRQEGGAEPLEEPVPGDDAELSR